MTPAVVGVTIPGLAEAIETAFTQDHANFPTNRVVLDDHIGMWVFAVSDLVWDRWACEEDECPGRPAWERGLWEREHAASVAIKAEVFALVRQRLAEFAERFQAEHPEAVLRAPAA